MKVIITRKELDSKNFGAKLSKIGMHSLISPVIKIVSMPTEVQNISEFQSIIITSKNTLTTIKTLSLSKKTLMFCVGDATARLFKKAGFSNIRSASGSSEDLLRMVKQICNPMSGPVLYLAGRNTRGLIERELSQSGFKLEKRIVYQAEAATSLTDTAQQALRDGEIVGIFIFSPRSAMILNELIGRFSLEDSLKSVTAFCLSEAVAKEASNTVWKKILVSEKPTQKSILALAKKNSKSLIN